jgi:hypothetical protein
MGVLQMFEIAPIDQIRPITYLNRGILILQQGQHEQHYRPLTTRLDNALIDQVLQDTSDGLNVNPATLLRTASTIIRPSDQAFGTVNIANGMQQRRFSFMLEFITTGTPLGTITEIVTGYTDNDQVSASGAIAPELRFYVNDVTTLVDTAETYIDIRGQKRFVKKVKDDFTLLRVPDYSVHSMVSLRPQDVPIHLWSADIRAGAGEVIDPRTSMSGPPKMTMNDDASSHRYLTAVVDAYFTGANPYHESTRMKNNDYNQDVHNAAHSAAAVRQNGTMFFHRALYFGGVQSTVEFTYRQLQSIWNVPDDRWEVLLTKGNRMRQPLLYSERWGGALIETGIVYSLTHLLPNIMGKFMVGAAAFSLTNQTFGKEIIVAPIQPPFGLFDNILTPIQLKQMCDVIKTDLVYGVILPRADTFDIVMEIQLSGLTHYEISINGGPKIPFDAPMFCEGIYSPMIGLNVENLNTVATDILTLTDNILSASAGYTTRSHAPTNLFSSQPKLPEPIGDVDRFLLGSAPNMTSKYT